MSDESETSAGRFPPEDVPAILHKYYHWPILLAIVGFMAWIRAQTWENFLVEGELYFSGNDAWYHLRNVEYTVENWPAVMPYEIWTGFPTGNLVGQFGTLFDQLIATAALILGLGSPTTQQIGYSVLFAPVVFGSLVAIPTYFIGRRLAGRPAGLFGAVLLALFPGTFLQRGLVGFADHNVAEPLFQALAVLGLMVAVTVAERERPIWEQVVDRDYVGLKRVVTWSALAGAAVAAYMWTWPPGILLVGIFGVYLLVKLTSDFYNGVSPDHVGFAGAVSMGTAGLLMFVPISTMSWGTTDFSLLHPLFTLAVAIGAVFLAWLARQWEARDINEAYYPVAVLAILLVGIALVSILMPRLYSLITTNFLRFVGFDAAAAQRTIGEAQPFPSSRAGQLGLSGVQVIFLEYGAAFFTAMLAGAWMLLRPHLASNNRNQIALAGLASVVTIVFVAYPALPDYVGTIFGINGSLVGIIVIGAFLAVLAVTEEYDAERLLVLVWSVFILAAAFTQIRFNYYLVVPVAVLNAYLLRAVVHRLGLDLSRASLDDIEVSHILAIATVLVIVIAPLVAPISFANQNNQKVPMQNAWETGQNNGPGAVTRWDPTLQWMANNTPAEGDYGDANNDDQLEYYGSYSQPPDGDFDYPEGSYGVMSWWDYGHWITVRGERIPNANPFQQHATEAANYLLAPDETRANDLLDEYDEDDAKTRYVAVDWKMVAPQGKFGAPIVFYDANESLERSDMVRGQIYNPNQQSWITLKSQRYYESQMVRLYRYHGSAKRAQPIVVNFEQRTFEAQGEQVQVPTYNGTKQFRSMEAARNYQNRNPTSTIGGISDFPSEDVPALKHYRLVKTSNQYLAPANYMQNGEFNYQNFPTWVKVFERVPGATVEGTAPPNTTVTARVEMAIPFPKQPGTFNYTQHAETGPDGAFEMTLPYSSTGYENYGPENGYTNASVRATGPYTFSTPTQLGDNLTVTRWEANASVSEAKVIGEDPEPVQVSLEKRVVDEIELGNQTEENATSENSTTTSENSTSGDDSSLTIEGNESNGSSTQESLDTSVLSGDSSSPEVDADSRDGDTISQAETAASPE